MSRDKPVQNGFCESFNGRMRDELLNETLFLSLAHARVEIAAWVEDYNRERPHSSLGYATPAAFAAELNKQWPASLRPTGSATQPIASTALMRNKLLCHLKLGPFAARVFGRRFPWLGKESWDEGIEVYGRAEGVRY